MFHPDLLLVGQPDRTVFGPLKMFAIAGSNHPNHTVATRALQAYLRWRNINARHPAVLAAQRLERARVRSERAYNVRRARSSSCDGAAAPLLLGAVTLTDRVAEPRPVRMGPVRRPPVPPTRRRHPMSLDRARRRRPRLLPSGVPSRVIAPPRLHQPPAAQVPDETPPPPRPPREGRSWIWGAIASLIAALAAVASVVYTGLSLDATHAQNETARQAQLTDRFSKAVDQLDRAGVEHLQARLGALYALERLAADSARDHPMIVEVVSAFIRTTTPQRAMGPRPGEFGPCPDQPVTADITAALTILTRRDRAREPRLIDLRYTCLRHVDLYSKDLRGLDLRGADLSEADLRGARLSETILQRTRFVNARLMGAYLDSASALSADFTSAYLVNSHFIGTQLVGAVFVEADLRGAEFEGAYLMGADFTGAVHDDTTIVRNAVVDSQSRGGWW